MTCEFYLYGTGGKDEILIPIKHEINNPIVKADRDSICRAVFLPSLDNN